MLLGVAEQLRVEVCALVERVHVGLQVKPTPPWSRIAPAVTSGPATDAAVLAMDAASASPLGLGVGGPG